LEIFLAVVKNEIADSFVQELHKDENGTNACIIGDVTTQHAGKVVLKSRIGGSRVVNYLTGEQLPRIC
jgi:hydrogenase expression/formation protein HypE